MTKSLFVLILFNALYNIYYLSLIQYNNCSFAGMKLVGVALIFCALTDLTSGKHFHLKEKQSVWTFRVHLNAVNKTTVELFCDQGDHLHKWTMS